MAPRWITEKRPPEPWEGRAQVVDVRRSRLEPAMVEVAVVLQAAQDAFTHRRIRCLGSDLDAGPMFVSSTTTAAHGGAPSQPRWVHDEDFDTFDAAMASAETRRPQASPREWQTRDALGRRVESERFLRRLQPVAADLSPVQALAAFAAYWICAGVAGLAGAVVAKTILEWAPWETVEGMGELVIFTALILVPVVIVGAHFLSMAADLALRDLFSGHNLDVTINGTEARSLAEEVRVGVRGGAHDARRWIARNRPRRQLEPGRHEAPPPDAASIPAQATHASWSVTHRYRMHLPVLAPRRGQLPRHHGRPTTLYRSSIEDCESPSAPV